MLMCKVCDGFEDSLFTYRTEEVCVDCYIEATGRNPFLLLLPMWVENPFNGQPVEVDMKVYMDNIQHGEETAVVEAMIVQREMDYFGPQTEQEKKKEEAEREEEIKVVRIKVA